VFEYFLQTTPDTTDYMIGGLVVFFVVMALYLGSLALRNRNLKQDLASLEEIEEE
jgi:NADH:ubiquinone oxidoreductase subunit 4 (subunit M)